MEIHKLFRMMAKHEASDLHLKVGQPPTFRVAKKLSRMQNVDPLTEEQMHGLLDPLMDDDGIEELARNGNKDFAHYAEGIGRFRCNVFRQCGSLAAAIRRVNSHVPGYEELGLPPQVKRIAGFEQGLVLVGGVTGSGKSTTLAAIINDINANRRCHVLTIEDPIEYLFTEDKAIINQRELGIDVLDFEQALRSAVRQDPDVMLVGELRDAKTFETALTAAETGHLVFGTIHSSSCGQTLARIMDLFPSEKAPLIRSSFAANMRCVMNQKLLRGTSKDHPMVPAVEMMFNTPIIKKLILDKEDNKLSEAIKSDKEHGCQHFNDSLYKLFKANLIKQETALAAAPNPDELRMSMRGISIQDGGIV